VQWVYGGLCIKQRKKTGRRRQGRKKEKIREEQREQ
jgi:hypothetical protein